MCLLAAVSTAAPQSDPGSLDYCKTLYDKNVRTIGLKCNAWKQKAFVDYRSGLRRALVAAQNSADFEGTKAVMAEEERFLKEKTIPESSPDGLAPAVAEVLKQYHSALAQAEKRKDKETLELSRRYVTSLETMMKKFLIGRRMEEAGRINDEIKRVKEKIAAIEAAKASKAAGTPPVSTNAPAAHVR